MRSTRSGSSSNSHDMNYIRLLWTILGVLASLCAGYGLYLLVVILLALRDWEPYQ